MGRDVIRVTIPRGEFLRMVLLRAGSRRAGMPTDAVRGFTVAEDDNGDLDVLLVANRATDDAEKRCNRR